MRWGFFRRSSHFSNCSLVVAGILKKYPWFRKPVILFMMGLFVAFVVDIFTSPIIAGIILWALGFANDIQPGQDDLGFGVLIMATYAIVFIFSFPIWAWISIRRVFILFSGK